MTHAAPEFLLLWSGDVPGMRKARIPGVEHKRGYIGHYRQGKCYLPDAKALRAALPARFRPSFDRDAKGQTVTGLPQVWADARNNEAPLTIHLRYAPRNGRPGRIMATLYLQPLRGEGA